MADSDTSDKLVEFYSNITAGNFKDAVAYNQVIIGAGYAGAFALWNMAKGYIPPAGSLWVVSSLGISLFLFIMWNVFSMAWLALNAQTYHQQTEGKKGEEYITAFKRAERMIRRRHREVFMPIWKIHFPITLVMGLIGIGILFVNAAVALLTISLQ
jgi:hypothetical protein